MNKLAFKLDIENIFFGIDTAIPCGFVINELVSNSLKYAFPEEKKGEIKIIMSKIDYCRLSIDDLKEKDHQSKIHNRQSKSYELIVSDNGIGLAKDFDFRNSKSLGLELVVSIVEDQLEGEIELNRTNGTEFRIRFEEMMYKKRV